MLSEIGVGSGEDIERAKRDSEGLRLFVRSLVGMDRGAAKEAFGGFLAGKTLRPAQIEFLDLIIDHLTDQGAMSPARLYEPPFTDLNGGGVDGMFSDGEVEGLISILVQVRQSAAA